MSQSQPNHSSGRGGYRGRGSGRGNPAPVSDQIPASSEPGSSSKPPRFRPFKQEIAPDMETRQPAPAKAPPPTREPNFKPTSLSTTFTEPKNDPSYIKETMVDGLNGFRFRSRTLEFKVDTAAFQQMIEACYTVICHKDSKFRKSISPASFGYYCNTALWYRFVIILDAQGRDDQRISEVLSRKLGSVPLPKPLAQYLSCLGNFTDANQRKWKLVVPDIFGDGHFGVMDNNTFVDYMAYPAPLISMISVTRELRAYNEADDIQAPWGIDAIMPPGNPHFSRNVGGYYLPNKISGEMMRELQNIGMTEDDFPHDDHGGIGVNQDLFNLVKDYIVNQSAYPVEATFPTSGTGSIMQMAFARISGPVEPGNRRRITDLNVEAFCSHQLHVQSACAAVLFKTRINRAARDDGYPVLPIVPALPAGGIGPVQLDLPPWNNFGSVYNFGDTARWANDDFVIGSVNGLESMTEFVHNFTI